MHMAKKAFFFIIVFFLCGCGINVKMAIGNSELEKAKRAAMCKERCKKEHYPDVKFIRADGTMEVYKINIVSISGRTACECKF